MLARLIKQCSLRICRSFSKSPAINHSIEAKVSPEIETASRKMTRNMKEFVLELNTPFEELDCKEAFDNLTETERKYLHFYTKVSRHLSLFTFRLECHLDLFIILGFILRIANLVCANISRGTVDFLTVPSDHCSRQCRVSAFGLRRQSSRSRLHCKPPKATFMDFLRIISYFRLSSSTLVVSCRTPEITRDSVTASLYLDSM